MAIPWQAIVTGAQLVGDYLDNQQAKKATDTMDDMYAQIQETAGVMKDKYEEIFDVANYFKPGGGAWKDSVTESMDTAFTTARKGQEDLLGKGINMTSYGTSVGRDVVSNQFIDNLVKKRTDITNMGSAWANVGTGLMSDWANLLQSSFEGQMEMAMESYKDATSGQSFLDTLGGENKQIGGDLAKWFGGLGGGSGTPNLTDIEVSDAAPGEDAVSDYRLKENIKLTGKSSSGINIYEFDYKNKQYGEGRYRGVMAQEVPKASFRNIDGYLWVDYSKVDVNFERIG
jgi:hypothetical protein